MPSLRASDGMMSRNLSSLKDAYLKTLSLLCKRGKEQRVLLSSKGNSVFLMNNISLVVKLIRSFKNKYKYAIDGALVVFFEDKMKQQTLLYIEEELMECFGPVLRFVKQEEHHIASSLAKPQAAQGDVEGILREFSGTWKGGLELLNSSVMTYFSTEGESRDILKQMLTQMLLYYTRFQEIVNKYYEINGLKTVVQIGSIMEEIKRYSRPS